MDAAVYRTTKLQTRRGMEVSKAFTLQEYYKTPWTQLDQVPHAPKVCVWK